ncbi:DUF4173 domain-containing protein [Clostridia bacterium]|nr:DUF4173 domain-containing protein [Clostridia bacterium]
MIQSLLCGLLVSWLLLYYELGLGAFLSVQLLLLLVGYNMAKQGLMNKNWWRKATYIFALSLVFIVRDMLLFKVLTFMALPFAFGLFYVPIKDLSLKMLIPCWVYSVFRPLAEIHLLIKDGSEKLLKGRENVKHILFGLLISAAFLVFVLPLLISSDLVVEALASDFLEGFEITGSLLFRILFTIGLSSYLYAQGQKKMVQYLARKPKSEETLVPETHKKGSLEIVINTFLTVINLVYGLFVYIQIRYLFLMAGTLPEGITYAEYAREGFFQLLLVAVINVVLVAILEFLNQKQLRNQRWLENCTLSMTLMMSISSFYRMHLYESYYGYTSLRMLVFMFLIFLMGLILLLMVYIFSYKKTVLNCLLGFILLYYLGSSLFNIDGFVAKENIARYEENGQIHIYYLTRLSEDARSVVEPFLIEHEDLYAEQYAEQKIGTYDRQDDYPMEGYHEDWRKETNWSSKDGKEPWQAWNRMKTFGNQ